MLVNDLMTPVQCYFEQEKSTSEVDASPGVTGPTPDTVTKTVQDRT